MPRQAIMAVGMNNRGIKPLLRLVVEISIRPPMRCLLPRHLLSLFYLPHSCTLLQIYRGTSGFFSLPESLWSI